MSKKQKNRFLRIISASLLAFLCFLIPEKLYILKAIAFIIPYAVVGYDIIFKAIRNVFNGQIFDENFLMSIATIGAYALGEFGEAVMVVLLYQAGELFQSYAVSRSRKSIASLMDIRPDYANIVSEGSYYAVSPEKVNIGDIILIKSGEKIPLDCIITEGKTNIDTSSLTGESNPLSVGVGDNIISGCVNISGTVYARVTKTFGESTVSKILELCENCADRKSRSENFITKFAKYYTPAVCILALCMAIIPSIFTDNLLRNIKSALVFLVVSCPCALVISVPLSFFCGIGCASKNGILIKGANFIEALSNAHTIIFDKTGTITKGSFSVTDIICEKGFTKETLLSLCASAEYYSEHPIAVAIKKEADNIQINSISDSKTFVGKGIFANVNGRCVIAGNLQLMKESGIEIKNYKDSIDTPIYVAVDGVFAGTIFVGDKIKENTKLALDKLKGHGIKRSVLLTGDIKCVGEAIGNELCIDEIHTELLPHDKVNITEEIIANTRNGKKTVFVGDGINDAPVLSRADIGIAMGKIGSDAAIEASDIVIMDDNLSKLPLSVSICKKTMRIVIENIVLAIGIKLIVIILSAFGYANMWLAIFADVGVAVLAILNALRTFKI